MYCTVNKIVRKNDDIHHSAAKIQQMLYKFPVWLTVELAESPSGVITAEIKGNSPFDPQLVERILFPKRHDGQSAMFS